MEMEILVTWLMVLAAAGVLAWLVYLGLKL
jgi:hypothetical protein